MFESLRAHHRINNLHRIATGEHQFRVQNSVNKVNCQKVKLAVKPLVINVGLSTRCNLKVQNAFSLQLLKAISRVRRIFVFATEGHSIRDWFGTSY